MGSQKLNLMGEQDSLIEQGSVGFKQARAIVQQKLLVHDTSIISQG